MCSSPRLLGCDKNENIPINLKSNTFLPSGLVGINDLGRNSTELFQITIFEQELRGQGGYMTHIFDVVVILEQDLVAGRTHRNATTSSISLSGTLLAMYCIILTDRTTYSTVNSLTDCLAIWALQTFIIEDECIRVRGTEMKIQERQPGILGKVLALGEQLDGLCINVILIQNRFCQG